MPQFDQIVSAALSSRVVCMRRTTSARLNFCNYIRESVARHCLIVLQLNLKTRAAASVARSAQTNCMCTTPLSHYVPLFSFRSRFELCFAPHFQLMILRKVDFVIFSLAEYKVLMRSLICFSRKIIFFTKHFQSATKDTEIRISSETGMGNDNFHL